MLSNAQSFACGIIAKNYGIESQSFQCIEEMSELAKALIKSWRLSGNGQPVYGIGNEEAHSAILEELADVQIMIEQLIHLYDGDGGRVDSMVTQKIKRQLLRMSRERKEKNE